MQLERAVTILTRLRDGYDPTTDKPLRDDHPCQQPDVVRALYTVLGTLSSGSREQHPSANGHERPVAVNRGKPWSPEDDERLAALFDEGRREKALSREFGRSRYAVRMRLEKLGKVAVAAAAVS